MKLTNQLEAYDYHHKYLCNYDISQLSPVGSLSPDAVMPQQVAPLVRDIILLTQSYLTSIRQTNHTVQV